MQVMVNLYGAHMDPDDWQQPQQFRPERFLDQSGNVIGRDKVVAFSLGTCRLCRLICAYVVVENPKLLTELRCYLNFKYLL